MTILEYQKAQNTVLDKEQVEQAWIAMGQACRSRLLAIPVKVTPLLDGKGKMERKKLLEDYIYEALKELSQTKPADINSQSNETETAPSEDKKPAVKEKDQQSTGKKKGRPKKKEGEIFK